MAAGGAEGAGAAGATGATTGGAVLFGVRSVVTAHAKPMNEKTTQTTNPRIGTRRNPRVRATPTMTASTGCACLPRTARPMSP